MTSQQVNDKVKREMQMFGRLEHDIRRDYMESITAKCSGLEMVVAGIMSDCQEMMAMNNPTIPSPHSNEYVRKQLNIAKFILFEMMDAKREKEAV